MIVKPTLFYHPRFRRLRMILKKDALYVLMRIWAHCETEIRDEFWQVDQEYVEMVAEWDGPPGKCLAALIQTGWISAENGGFRVNSWNTVNKSLRSAWTNGSKGGRVSASASKTGKTGGLPVANQPANQPVTDGDTGRITNRRGLDRIGEESPQGPPDGGVSGGGTADIPNPPVMVSEDLARSWLANMNADGAGFSELDFQEAFRLLHGTRDVRTGAWRVGRNSLVSDPRVVFEQRLHDAQGRRLRAVTNPTASMGSSAAAFRQKISALQDEIRNHKGNPDGSWPEHVRDANASAFQLKTRELNELTRRLSELNESVTGA